MIVRRSQEFLFITFLSIRVPIVNPRSARMAFKFSLISVMRSAVDVSHFDIFETADFSEGVQKRPFYKYCDLEINSHFIFLL